MMRFDWLVSAPGSLSVVLLVTLCAAACREDRTAWQGTIRRGPDGATLVENPTEPLISRLEAELLWMQGGEEAQSPWGIPSQVIAVEDGVLVLDPVNAAIYRLDDEGRWLATWGGPGRGPGELMQPYDMNVLGEFIIIGNGGTGTIEVWDSAGEHVRSIPANAVGFAQATIGRDRFVFVGLRGNDERKVVYDVAGSASEYPVPMPAEIDGLPPCSRLAGAAPTHTVMNCHTGAITVYDSAGRRIRHIELPWGVERASDTEIETARKTMLAEIGDVPLPAERRESLLISLVDGLKIKPRFRALIADRDSGRFVILEQDPPELGSTGATFHFLEADGRYLGTLDFAAKQVVDYAATGDRLVLLVEDAETGLRVVETYELHLNRSETRA